MFVQLLINGLAIGAIYALVALGFVFVISAANIVNFAHGELVMLGAFLGVTFVSIIGLPTWLGFLLVIPAMALVGIFFTYLAFNPLDGKHFLVIVMATTGMSIALQNAAILIWGPYALTFPVFFGSQPLDIMGAKILPHNLVVIGVAIFIVTTFQLVMNRTPLGYVVQASSQDAETALLMGIPVKKVKMIVYIAASIIAGIAGFLVGPIFLVTSGMGFSAMIKGMVAGIVGGWGNLKGAITAGVFLGLVETFAAAYISSAYKDAIAFLVLVLVLFVRPQGIFGERVQVKV